MAAVRKEKIRISYQGGPMAKKKAILGGLYSLPVMAGVGLFQCVHVPEDKTKLHIIRVLPGIHSASYEDFRTVVDGPELFFKQFALDYGLKKSVIGYLGQYDIPDNSHAPDCFRMKDMVRGEFKGWLIVNRKTQIMQRVMSLSNKQIQLSPYGSISIPDLEEKILTGWTPKMWN